ncbi:MAG: acetyl/propionyl-CoA carboxylase alpha subunit, partial [Saprospiraceae bacterium]
VDGSVFIEKYVESPRHIEIQVLADEHENVVHLFERDCSIQRRHQKVVEEAPSAVLSTVLRNAMGAAAVMVAKACDYVGAGTVEFLLDSDMQFYFLEMNTRLQVEHPVTELITGLDLVEEQIKIAQGQPLTFSQDQLEINGHALELRVYSEDPLQDFTPRIGTLKKYVRPVGPGIRVDDGYEEGMEIPIFYDSMIAKLIVHAKTRQEAILLMSEAIDQYKIEGVATTLSFGRYVMKNSYFLEGDFDTHFVKKHYRVEDILNEQKEEAFVAAQVATKVWLDQKEQLQIPIQRSNNWPNSRSV